MKAVAADGMLSESFERFRECGEGRRECVVYWTGPRDQPTYVDRVEHPVHRSSAGGYEVDSSWVTKFFARLRKEGRCTRVQLHTHPTFAGHSTTDDRFALVPATGFLSLVFPDFATGPITLRGAHLVMLDQHGEWRTIPVSELEAP